MIEEKIKINLTPVFKIHLFEILESKFLQLDTNFWNANHWNLTPKISRSFHSAIRERNIYSHSKAKEKLYGQVFWILHPMSGNTGNWPVKVKRDDSEKTVHPSIRLFLAINTTFCQKFFRNFYVVVQNLWAYPLRGVIWQKKYF